MSNSPSLDSGSSVDEHSQSGEGEQLKRGVELESRVLTVEKKRYYIDVKQNERGRFVQIVALLTGGRKSRVILGLQLAKKLAASLDKASSVHISEYPKTLARLTSGSRVYFVDLRQNEHGSFLRLTQTLTRSQNRFSVYIPVEGIEDLCKVLIEVTEKFGESDAKELKLPPSQQLRDIRNKMLYFDCNSNDFGDYLRITETRFSSENRASITVSLKNLERFHEILGDVLSKFRDLRGVSATTADESSTDVKGQSATVTKS